MKSPNMLNVDMLGLLLHEAQKEELKQIKKDAYIMYMLQTIASGERLTADGKKAFDVMEHLGIKKQKTAEETGDEIYDRVLNRVNSLMKGVR